MAEPYRFRALIVAAVSSKAQAKPDRFSLDDQLSSGRAVCRERAWPIVDEVILEGQSRNYEYLDELLADSPDYAEILRWIRSGQIDVIVVRHDDRLWRTMDLQYDVSRIMRRNNVQLYDISKPREPTPPDQLRHTAIDKLIDAVGGFSAENENEKRVARMAHILRDRVLVRGLQNGRPPYGYRIIEPNMPAVQIAGEIHWVILAGEWRRSYLGIGLICHRLNEMGSRAYEGRPWRRAQVRTMLHNPFYAGYVRYGDKLQKGHHEPCWTEAEWQAIQEANRSQGAWAGRRGGELHELSGLCVCGICGTPMAYDSKRGRRLLYCGARVRAYDINSTGHGGNYHTESLVLAGLIQIVQSEVADPDAFAEARRKARGVIGPEQIAAIEEQTKECRRKIERWNAALEVGGIGPLEFRDRRSELEIQIAQLQQQAEQLRVQAGAAAQIGADAREVAGNLAQLPRMSPEKRRAIWVKLIKRIRLLPGKPAPTVDDIEWR